MYFAKHMVGAACLRRGFFHALISSPWNLVVFFVLSACDKGLTDKGDRSSPNASVGNSVLRKKESIIPFQLPINEVLKAVDVGILKNDVSVLGSQVKNLQLVEAVKTFEESNNIKSNSTGCFMVNSSEEVIGYSIWPYFALIDNPDAYSPERKPGAPYDIVPQIRWSYSNTEIIDDITVKSLDGIKKLKTVEFINFNSVGFASGIWTELADMSKSGALRGISLVNGESLIRMRNNEVVPQIKGLVVHLSKVSSLKRFGAAFPNLAFLCVAVSNREEINVLFQEDMLRVNFPNLEALMVGDSSWPDSGSCRSPAGRDTDARIRLNPQRVPQGVKWICIDGNLLSTDDMIRYDEFGARLRYNNGRASMKLKPDREIDVVYMGFGFSAGGARSMKVWEYSTLEKFWRPRLALNPLSK
jgi:hypothetical protein